MASSSIDYNYGKQPSLTTENPILSLAVSKESSLPGEALELYQQLIFSPSTSSDQSTNEVEYKFKEQAIFGVCRLLPSAAEMYEFGMALAKTVWPVLPRARPAHLVKKILEVMAERFPSILDDQVNLVQGWLSWAKADNRAVLTRFLQGRLATLNFASHRFTDALAIIHPLAHELTRIDDKLSLLELQLLEGRVWMSLNNYSKARAAFTAARTTANLIAVPGGLQAALDLHTGKLYLEEGEPSLAFANFIEALDGFHTDKQPNGAKQALQLMILSKIMSDSTSDIPEILKSKIAVNYVEATRDLVKISETYASRSLADYDALLKGLSIDEFVLNHLRSLYQSLLRGNLMKLVTPYARIPIPYVAQRIGLDPAFIESTLCQMILDSTLHAVIDQETNTLILLEEEKECFGLKAAISTVKSLDKAVDALYEKAALLH